MNKLVCIIVLFVFAITSCATPVRNVSYPQTGHTNNAAIAVKDYEPVAVIYVSAQEIIYKPGDHTGSKITHEMLMKEAEKYNAHDVINVKIDVKHKEEIINNGSIRKTTYDYTAVGLAIRYTRAIEGASGSSTNINASILPEIQEQDKSKKRKAIWWTAGSLVAVGIITTIVIIAASNRTYDDDYYYGDNWNNNYDPYYSNLSGNFLRIKK